MRKLSPSLILILILAMACKMEPQASGPSPEVQQPDTLTLAFDWRPNVLHSGILYAQARGWYRDTDLVVQWFTPEVDNYTRKPLKKMLAGKADGAIGPSEHLFYYALDSAGNVQAQAIASILQQDRSVFVAQSREGLSRLADLEGMPYLGYHTPLEKEIWQNMLLNDGASGAFEVAEPGRLAVWEAFLQEPEAVAWVFDYWEALQAEMAGIPLRRFSPQDYGVPYGYSSVLMVPKNLDSAKASAWRRFLAVTQQGYQHLCERPKKALALLVDSVAHPNFEQSAFLTAAQESIAPAYLDADGAWGKMEGAKWQDYAAWMRSQGLLGAEKVDSLTVQALYTNAYLSRR